MKILIEIQDNKAKFFLELLKSFNFIKKQEVLEESEECDSSLAEEPQSEYDPEFVAKNLQSKKDIAEGKGIPISPKDLDELCK